MKTSGLASMSTWRQVPGFVTQAAATVIFWALSTALNRLLFMTSDHEVARVRRELLASQAEESRRG